MKLAAFDIEIFKTIPEGETDWNAHRPLGISCAAIKTNDDTADLVEPVIPGRNPLAPHEVQRIIFQMKQMVDEGYIFVTVNGLGFDFDILAEESSHGGMREWCADIALNHHCDLMFMSVCELGWPVGLQALAEGAGVKPKLKTVTLKDGTALQGMDGAKAPELWQAGEFDAVLAYLRQDVQATLETAQSALKVGYLGWYSSTGRWWQVRLPSGKLPTVADCLKWDRPDTSWMDNPITREGLVAWTGEYTK